MKSLTMLLDCSNLFHKAFYKKEVDYVEEFYTTINRLKRCFKPTNVIFSLDSDFITWRHVAYEPYKAQRPIKSPKFITFKETIQKHIKENEVFMFLEGYESDDLIGSYVAKYKSEEDILIITQDLDHGQLLDDNVLQLKFRGDFELEHVDKQYILNRFNVEPKYLADLKAISGDKSDNIKGLWRVGDKKASEYINKYGGLPQILESLKKINVDERTELDQRFIDNEAQLLLNLRLTTIVKDLDV
jgi:DNA polymerase-1